MTTDTPAFGPLPPGAHYVRVAPVAALDADGEDARTFLHGQLSSDVNALPAGAAQYASYNSPKGRMLATMIVWRRSETRYTLLLAPDVAAAIGRRLAMFVLRAKVALTASDRRYAGVLGADAARMIAPLAGAPAGGGGAAWPSVQQDGLAILPLPDGRFVIDAEGPLPGAIEALPTAGASLWNWCGIRAGVPVITAATSDKLVAQSANWELVGGVDFRKGCYPGQEIIARMQYLGRLKERLRGFHTTAGAVAEGQSLETGEPGEAAGTVVNAADAPGGGIDLLAVVHNDALSRVTAAGAPLAPRALPYAVPALENVRVKL